MSNITPKEAIANLNHIYGMVAPDIQRSLDVAIKALERPQGDCISREALRKEFESEEWLNKVYPLATNERGGIVNKRIYALIDSAPTVNIKDQIAGAYNEGYMCGSKEAEKARPKGEWYALNFHTCYCTNCHFDFDIMKCDFMEKMKFCPNCGAKMKGGAE